MAKTAAHEVHVSVEGVETPKQSMWNKEYRLISSKNVDYDNLSAFESAAMTLALVLSVIVGSTTLV
jgi:hypothetical protein